MNAKTSQLPKTSAELEFPAFHPSALQHQIRTVRITRLKNFASEKLSSRSALRDALLQEKDGISAADFLARLPVWLALLRQGKE